MGTKLSFGSKAPLEPGEVILYQHPSIGFVSALSLPTYRIFFPIPMVMRLELNITNKRLLIVTRMFGKLLSTFWAWYPSQKPPQDDEEIAKFSTSSNKMGEYLEIITKNKKRPWYLFCGKKIRFRFYTRDSKRIFSIISSTSQSG